MKKLYLFIFLIIAIKTIYPQNSLYLVDTLTGTSVNNKFWKAEGIGDFNGDGYNDFAISSPYNWDDGLGRVYLFKGGKTLLNISWLK